MAVIIQGRTQRERRETRGGEEDGLRFEGALIIRQDGYGA